MKAQTSSRSHCGSSSRSTSGSEPSRGSSELVALQTPRADSCGAEQDARVQRARDRFQQLLSGPRAARQSVFFEEIAERAPEVRAPADGPGSGCGQPPSTTAHSAHMRLLGHAQRSIAYTVWSAGSLSRSLGPSGGPDLAGACGVFTALCSLYEVYATQCDVAQAHKALGVLCGLLQAEQSHLVVLRDAQRPFDQQQRLALKLTRINVDLLSQSICSFEQRLLTPGERSRREQDRALQPEWMRLRRSVFKLEQRRVQQWRLGEHAQAQALEQRASQKQSALGQIDRRLQALRRPSGLAPWPVAEQGLCGLFDQLSHADIKLLRDARLQLLRAPIDIGAGALGIAIGVIGDLAQLVDAAAGLGLVSAAISASMALLDQKDAEREQPIAAHRKEQAWQAIWRAQACRSAYGEQDTPGHRAAARVLAVYQGQWARRLREAQRFTLQAQIRRAKGEALLPVAAVAAAGAVAVIAGTGGVAAIPAAVAAGAIGAAYYGSNGEIWGERMASKHATEYRWTACEEVLQRRSPLQLRALMCSPRGDPGWQELASEILRAQGPDLPDALAQRLSAQALEHNEYLVVAWLSQELHAHALSPPAGSCLARDLLLDLGMEEDLLEYLIASHASSPSDADHLERLRESLWEFFAARPQGTGACRGAPAGAGDAGRDFVTLLEVEEEDEDEAPRAEPLHSPARRPRHNGDLLRFNRALKQAGDAWKRQSPTTVKGRALMDERLPFARRLPNPLATPGRALRELDGSSTKDQARCCSALLGEMLQAWPADELAQRYPTADGAQRPDHAALLRRLLLELRQGCGGVERCAREGVGPAQKTLSQRMGDCAPLIDRLVQHIDASRMRGQRWWMPAHGPVVVYA